MKMFTCKRKQNSDELRINLYQLASKNEQTLGIKKQPVTRRTGEEKCKT